MKLKPYPKYKDSGIEWLGEVPEEWEIIRTDSVTDYIRNQINAEDIKSELVFHYSIPVVQETGTGQLEPTEDLGSAKQLITKKAILVSKLNPRKATICIAEPQDMVTICSSEFVAIKATKCDIEYLYYLVNSEKNRQRLDASVQSVTRSHQRVYPSDIYKFWTALPNWEDQQAIASFLDRETTRIDALIQKKERMIELLKEKRIALITQAVTKGLDPNVPMRDSGIEWLGEVPEHWRITSIKHIAKVVNGSTPSSSEPDFWDGDILWATPDDLGSLNDKYLCSTNRQITKEGYQSCGTTIAPGNSIVLSTRAPIGHVALTLNDMCCNQGCKILVPQGSIVSDYLYYLLLSSKAVLDALGQGSTFKELNRERLSSFKLPLPRIEEQKDIITYIDLEILRNTQISEKLKESISLLREYRASLIHHAVTGKIDLRGYDAKAQ